MPPEEDAVNAIRGELTKEGPGRWRRTLSKFLMAAIGSIPWVGGFLAAAASIRGDEAALRTDDLQTQWLDGHRKKLEPLRGTLDDLSDRFEKLGPDIEERIQSPEYLALVRQIFRTWDRAETEDKRRYVANLLANAAGSRICSDDVLRLFISWLELYHEAHFAVIREIFKNPGSTRYDIWVQLYGDLPGEEPSDACPPCFRRRNMAPRPMRCRRKYGQFH
jgi:hypothetical protein